MDRRVIEAKALIEALGYTFVSYRHTRGGHARVVLSDGTITRFVIFPVSASDYRWKRNKKTEIRKLFRDYYQDNQTKGEPHNS